MADLKNKQTEASVEDFINSIEDNQRQQDCRRLIALMDEVTSDKPTMWGDSMVGYGSYDYKYASGRHGSWFKFGFSPRKQNLTLYIMSGFDEYADAAGYDPKPLLDQLGPHSTGKSCLYLKSLDKIDMSVLKELIRDSYQRL